MLRRAGVAVRSMGRKALAFLQRVINNIMEGVKKVFRTILNAGKAMFSKLLKFFGLAISDVSGIVGEVSL